MAIWNILQTFGIFYDHLEHFETIWYTLCSFGTFSGFGIIYQEKSGNPDTNAIFCRSFRPEFHQIKFENTPAEIFL
jgi:hypothetical protein